MSKNIQVAIQVIKNDLINQNTYLVINNHNEALIIDPGYSKDKIERYIIENKITPLGILITHYHFDHVASVDYFCNKFNVFAHVHSKDLNQLLLDTLATKFGMPNEVRVSKNNVLELLDGENKISSFVFDVVNVPGHSEGSSLFIFNDNVFTGDTLFLDTIGRTDIHDSDKNKMLESIKLIKNILKPDQLIYPGHGLSDKFENVLKSNLFLK